jgi:hypothetical protein
MSDLSNTRMSKVGEWLETNLPRTVAHIRSMHGTPTS